MQLNSNQSNASNFMSARNNGPSQQPFYGQSSNGIQSPEEITLSNQQSSAMVNKSGTQYEVKQKIIKNKKSLLNFRGLRNNYVVKSG